MRIVESPPEGPWALAPGRYEKFQKTRSTHCALVVAGRLASWPPWRKPRSPTGPHWFPLVRTGSPLVPLGPAGPPGPGAIKLLIRLFSLLGLSGRSAPFFRGPPGTVWYTVLEKLGATATFELFSLSP